MEWKKQVELGLLGMARIEDGKWMVGDLALDVLPPGPAGAHDEGHLRRYAEAIGCEYDSLRQYRQVAAAWPPATRVAGMTWAEHREFRAMPTRHDVFTPNMTKEEAKKAITRGRSLRRSREAAPKTWEVFPFTGLDDNPPVNDATLTWARPRPPDPGLRSRDAALGQAVDPASRLGHEIATVRMDLETLANAVTVYQAALAAGEVSSLMTPEMDALVKLRNETVAKLTEMVPSSA